MKKGGQASKALFLFVICYNCGGKRYTKKSCTSASRAVLKKIERKAKSAGKGKKKAKIITDDMFTKLVNPYRILSPTPGPAPKTLISAVRIVETVLDLNEINAANTKSLVKRAE